MSVVCTASIRWPWGRECSNGSRTRAASAAPGIVRPGAPHLEYRAAMSRGAGDWLGNQGADTGLARARQASVDATLIYAGSMPICEGGEMAGTLEVDLKRPHAQRRGQGGDAASVCAPQRTAPARTALQMRPRPVRSVLGATQREGDPTVCVTPVASVTGKKIVTLEGLSAQVGFGMWRDRRTRTFPR